jgi:hypothetical protein
MIDGELTKVQRLQQNIINLTVDYYASSCTGGSIEYHRRGTMHLVARVARLEQGRRG